MNSFLPNLPKGNVSAVIISPEYPDLIYELNSANISTFFTGKDENLPEALCFHPDILCLNYSYNKFYLSNNQISLKNELEANGVECKMIKTPLKNSYPGDSALNAALAGKNVFLNRGSFSKECIVFFKKSDFNIIDVKQGYTKCSVAIVSERAIITSDKGIARAAEENEIKALVIQAGYIKLKGYDYGFIGGCCGKLAPDVLAFAGDVTAHPDYKKILHFCEAHGVRLKTLAKHMPLTDIGGILPVL